MVRRLDDLLIEKTNDDVKVIIENHHNMMI